MAFENQNILDKKNTIDQSQIDTKGLEESLKSWWERREITNESNQDVKKIIEQLVVSNISPAQIESMLAQLPLDKRFIIEKMILDEQRHQIATMSQEKYKQYLQSQFPQGVPENIWDMAISLVADTSEMYKNVKQEIGKTGLESQASEIPTLWQEQRIATSLVQKSEAATSQLSNDLSHIA